MAEDQSRARQRRESPGAQRARSGQPNRSPLIAVAVVLAIAAVVLGFLGARGTFRSAPTHTPSPSVVVIPLPTPTVAPAPFESTTALGATIPATVLTYALESVTPVDTSRASADPLQDAGAVEAYRIAYTDGAEHINVELAQWPAGAGADAYAQAVTAALPPDAVPGVGPGLAWLWADTDGGHAVWTNGTVVVTATGPFEALVDFQEAYPL